MSRGFVKFIALIGFILICLFCLLCNSGRIENDLQGRSLQTLKSAGIQLDKIHMDGRDVILEGEVDSEQAKSRAEQLVSGVYGVRKVINNLIVRKNEPIEPPPPPSKEAVDLTALLKDVRIGFELNSARLDREARVTLDKAAAILKKAPKIRVTITGHTDNLGEDAHNMILSQNRADAVLAYLAGKGIERSRLKAIGYGETKPIADNATAAGRKKNRRIEFQIMEEK